MAGAAPASVRGERARSLAAIIAAMGIVTLVYAITFPLFALVLHQQGVSHTLIGLSTMTQAGAVLFIAPLAPPLLRRIAPARLMQGITLASAALIVLAPGVPLHRGTAWLRAAFAVALVCLPMYRLVVQGGLSEPLFCAVIVGLAGALVRYRRDGSAFGWACVLAGAAGLLRFVGGVVVLMPAIEHYRRHRDPKRALLVLAGCVTPVALNTGLIWKPKGLMRSPGRVTIKILPPIPAGLPREEFMRELETRIESECQALLPAERRRAAA